VLEALWSAGAAQTPGEVHEALATDRRLAYTTVMTILARLWAKGELDRRRRGRAFEYVPVADREERVAQRMREVLEAAEDRSRVLSRFVAELPPAQRASLRRALSPEADGR